ncbi:hypothetical protein ANCCAN_00188 [Ancylostoma caninum]|uniref:HEAT repeat protein n=1 Tax=Ancylostoma caninum TaxID=29170 RepID=A0A368HAS5_ANCCA|nr:hypothetical protein ANCCAN_00188 [Ancylostoma caninum]
MMKCLSDENPEVRQAAAYGFGVMGQYGGKEYLHTLAHAIEPLGVMTLRPDAMDSYECIDATNNALVAVAKILKYSGKSIKLRNVVSKKNYEYMFRVRERRDEYLREIDFAMKGPRGVKINHYYVNWCNIVAAADVPAFQKLFANNN